MWLRALWRMSQASVLAGVCAEVAQEDVGLACRAATPHLPAMR